MSEWDDLGWGSLQSGLFGVIIAALVTDIFSTAELLAISLLLTLFGMLGVVAAMVADLGLVGRIEEVIGQ